MSTERLNQSTDRLRETRRVALETEDLGVSILEDLHQQRETLLHSHNKACCVSYALPVISRANLILNLLVVEGDYCCFICVCSFMR